MKLKLNDNTEFNYRWCGVAFTGDLVIAVENSTVSEVVAAALDSTKMSRITFYPDAANEEITKVMTGYTRFVAVQIDASENLINLSMGKEYAT